MAKKHLYSSDMTTESDVSRFHAIAKNYFLLRIIAGREKAANCDANCAPILSQIDNVIVSCKSIIKSMHKLNIQTYYRTLGGRDGCGRSM